MKHSPSLLLLPLVLMLAASCGRNNQTISLHPDNPHYFLFRGKPAILIGSTEHYGAVLNADFDYRRYLDELKANDLNVTRTFSGIYSEPLGAFGIHQNTLAPASGKLVCPWARSAEAGYANGGSKFDLDKWDEAYFARLKDFITEAGKRDIVVELDLFSNYYDTAKWRLCPLYHANNINNVGNFENHEEVLSMKHPEVVAAQEKMVRKIVSELKDMDNLYYEICNEPYFGDTLSLQEWQKHMTAVVADAEKDFTYRHLVSHNVANGSRKIEAPDSLVSIFNFHYAKPPVAVAMNYGLKKVTGDNETGFNGIEDIQYRTEAWDFIVAGGGLFNHLDYSFTVGNETGTFIVEKGQPGGGGKNLRSQLQILAKTIRSYDFVSMEPHSDLVSGWFPQAVTIRVLAHPGKEYLVYINNRQDWQDTIPQQPVKATFWLRLIEGKYSSKWINTLTGEKTAFELKKGNNGVVEINTPEFTGDIALEIRPI